MRARFLTKLRAPEGSTSQCQPGGAQSRTWRLSSRLSPPSQRRGCGPGIVDTKNVSAGIVGAEGGGEDAGDGGAAPARARAAAACGGAVVDREAGARGERRWQAAWRRRRGLGRRLGAERPDGDVEVRQPGGVVVFGAVGGN